MTTDSLTLIFLAAALAVAAWLALRRGSTSPAIVSLAGLKWTRADFCRGWLITGETGSGKTRSGITPLLYQVFQNEPGWGGLCIDDKGVYWETLCEMARHFGRENDLILLQIRPDSAPPGWQPTHTYNLTSDRSIPYNTFSKAVVDTASSLGQAGDKGFFKNQAQVHIARALEALREIRADVTLESPSNLAAHLGVEIAVEIDWRHWGTGCETRRVIFGNDLEHARNCGVEPSCVKGKVRIVDTRWMPHPKFTVDTHLFRELGELLVGRDSTALVELIKNSGTSKNPVTADLVIVRESNICWLLADNGKA